MKVDTDKVEATVIWDMIVRPETIPDISRVVRSRMFNDRDLRDAYVKIAGYRESGGEVDIVSFRGLVSDHAYGMVSAHLADDDGGGSTLDVMGHAYMLRKVFFCRSAALYAAKLMEKSSDLSMMPEALMTDTRNFCADMESMFGSASEKSLVQAVDDFGESVRETKARRSMGLPTCIPTGINFLDTCFLGGLKPCNLVYVAARPGVGKTAVMLAMMRAAAENGYKVKLWSLEMDSKELAERVMYSLGGIRPGEKLSGKVDWDGRWADARSVCERWGITIEDGLFGVEDILSDIAVSNQRGLCDVAFIDYFQLMEMNDGYRSQEEKLATMSRRLKNLAMRRKMPIVVNSQLNRENVREHRRPEISDMRGSGAMEQDADRIVLLHSRREGENRYLEMIIGKNREGGHVDEIATLKPNDTYTVFTELDCKPPTPDELDRQAMDNEIEAWEREDEKKAGMAAPQGTPAAKEPEPQIEQVETTGELPF